MEHSAIETARGLSGTRWQNEIAKLRAEADDRQFDELDSLFDFFVALYGGSAPEYIERVPLSA